MQICLDKPYYNQLQKYKNSFERFRFKYEVSLDTVVIM